MKFFYSGPYPKYASFIICRFYSRNTRAMIFRLKKEFADRLPGTTGNSQHSRGNGKFRYPIYEDLTRTNFFKMRAIAQHEAVHSCWSVSGHLRFKLNGENRIRKVKNILDPVEKIIETSWIFQLRNTLNFMWKSASLRAVLAHSWPNRSLKWKFSIFSFTYANLLQLLQFACYFSCRCCITNYFFTYFDRNNTSSAPYYYQFCVILAHTIISYIVLLNSTNSLS